MLDRVLLINVMVLARAFKSLADNITKSHKKVTGSSSTAPSPPTPATDKDTGDKRTAKRVFFRD